MKGIAGECDMRQLMTHDGLALDLLGTPTQACTLVFVNALGISSALAEPLAAAMERVGVSLLTWDRRGLPGAHDLRFREYGLDDQLDDLARLMERVPPGPVILAGWCTGIHTVLAYARQWPQRVQALMLFNSPNFFDSRLSGVAGDAIGKVSRILIEDESKLEFLYRAIFAHNTEQTGARITGLDDAWIRELVEAPFKSGPQALLRYMYLIRSAAQPKVDRPWCAAIRVPTLVVGGRQDTMVSYGDSASLADILPFAQLRILDDWGHYSLFSDTQASVSEVILPFLWTLDAFDGFIREARPPIDTCSAQGAAGAVAGALAAGGADCFDSDDRCDR
ncbi:hypothetical protein NS383_17645 [Pseudomonas oryzihabitans]|nr:hypothetical protein NS383_17645 [Pseudomonas psychrotolerans]